MSKIHLPKLTRTACGCKITKTILLSSDPSSPRIPWYGQALDTDMCLNCLWSSFVLEWRNTLEKVKHKANTRFGTTGALPESVLLEIAHKQTIEEYQKKGFNV